jgi:hypothetical protein
VVASTRFLTEATASKRKCGKAADQPSPVQGSSFVLSCGSAVEAQEEVPDSLAFAQRQPAPSLMLSPVVHEMTALTQRLQVPRRVLGRIMGEVHTGQHHTGCVTGQGRGQLSRSWKSPQRSASARAPDLVVLVPPAPIPKMTDQAAVGKRPWGRRHCSQRPYARRKRMTAESWCPARVISARGLATRRPPGWERPACSRLSGLRQFAPLAAFRGLSAPTGLGSPAALIYNCSR